MAPSLTVWILGPILSSHLLKKHQSRLVLLAKVGKRRAKLAVRSQEFNLDCMGVSDVYVQILGKLPSWVYDARMMSVW